MAERNAPIGIFDSGVGGLTVARAIVDQLPDESIIYIGDTANGPYGPQPISRVREHATRIADELVARGCKMLVIACNTASAAFLRDARERYDIPVVEVILPAVRRAVATTRNGKIGVIGTQGTVKAYVEPLQAAGVDTLVLGCTHYPLLSGVIQLAMGEHVTLVSSAEETAKDVVRILSENDMLAERDGDGAEPVVRSFESTGDPALFAQLADRFLGPHVTQVSQLGTV